MLNAFILLVICALVNEGLVELASKSVFFSFLRDFLSQSQNKVLKFFGEAINCPYCCSVWTGFILSGVVFFFAPPEKIIHQYIDYFIFSVLVHRVSNKIHDTYDQYINKSYRVNSGDLKDVK